MRRFRKILENELPFIFACPVFLWQFLFLYFPLFILLFYSVLDYSKVEGKYFFSLNSYFRVFTSNYLKVFYNSFGLAFLATVISLLFAYPVAYFIAIKVKEKFRTFFLVSLILPSWVNLIVQIYAWFFLLEKNSFLSWIFFKLNLFSSPPHMLNNYFAVLVGTIYSFLPFMILPIYAVLCKIDRQVLEASADLGASRLQTLRKIILPLSLPGIITGSLLVFIPVFGEFAIPNLLGGGKQAFLGSLIVEKFLMYKDWKMGAALSNVGILIISVSILFIFLFYKTLIFLFNLHGFHRYKRGLHGRK